MRLRFLGTDKGRVKIQCLPDDADESCDRLLNNLRQLFERDGLYIDKDTFHIPLGLFKEHFLATNTDLQNIFIRGGVEKAEYLNFINITRVDLGYAALIPPERIYDLLVFRELGQGGYGVALLAVKYCETKQEIWNCAEKLDVTPLRRYVVKRYWNNLKPHEVKSVEKELANTGRISNKLKNKPCQHVLMPLFPIPDKTSDVKQAMVFEYCNQGDLADFLEKWKGLPLSSYEATGMALQLLIGLEWLQTGEDPIIHRDITSRNIFLDCQGGRLVLKIGDFGLCRLVGLPDTPSPSNSPKTSERNVEAPEIRGGFSPDMPVDVFMMGVVIIEIMLGRRLDSSDDIYRCLDDLAPCYPELVPVVRRMVDPDRSRRCTATDARCELERQFSAWHTPMTPSTIRGMRVLGPEISPVVGAGSRTPAQSVAVLAAAPHSIPTEEPVVSRAAEPYGDDAFFRAMQRRHREDKARDRAAAAPAADVPRPRPKPVDNKAKFAFFKMQREAFASKAAAGKVEPPQLILPMTERPRRKSF